jgi:hypothetical protein
MTESKPTPTTNEKEKPPKEVSPIKTPDRRKIPGAVITPVDTESPGAGLSRRYYGEDEEAKRR